MIYSTGLHFDLNQKKAVVYFIVGPKEIDKVPNYFSESWFGCQNSKKIVSKLKFTGLSAQMGLYFNLSPFKYTLSS